MINSISKPIFLNPVDECQSSLFTSSTHFESERPLPDQFEKRKFKKADNSDLSIGVLPKELLALIFSFLNFKTCGSAQLVCRLWTTCINEPAVQAQVMKLRWPSLAIPRHYDINILKDLKNDRLGVGFFVAHEHCGVIKDKIGRALTGHSLVCSNPTSYAHQIFIYDLKKKISFLELGYTKNRIVHSMDLEGDILVTASQFEVNLWNIHTGTLLKNRRTTEAGKNRIYDVKIYNKVVYLCLENCIDSWDFQKDIHSKYSILPPDEEIWFPEKILFSEEYLFIIPSSNVMRIMMFNAKTKKHIRNLNGHTNLITCLAVQDNILISGSWDRSVIIWDVVTGKIQQQLTHESALSSLAIQGDMLLTGTSYFDRKGWKGNLRVWSLKTGQCLLTKKGVARVVGIQGDIIFAANDLILNTTIWDLKHELPHLYQ